MGKEMKENLLKKNDEEEERLESKVWRETKLIWVVAGPGIFSIFSTFGVFLITQAFVGQIGPTELAAFSIVFTIIVRFTNGILLGMASALETLCGQSYGAKQYHMLGIYLQRSWIVLTITAIIILPMYIFATQILILVGIDKDMAQVAGDICLWLIPALFAFVFSFTCQTYLQAQSKNMTITYMTVVSIVVHLFLSWLLLMKLELGLHGALVATNFALWIPNLGQLLYITCGGCKDTWNGLSFLAFKDLWPVIKLSLSSGIMVCLEVWYNSVLVLLTGNMKNAAVSIDALSICLSISGLELMIAIGFLAAASVRVSNELGRGSSKGAKFSIIVIVVQSFLVGVLFLVAFGALNGKLAYLFTQDEEVVMAIADLSPLLALSILLNSVQPVLSGVAIGAGWQSVVAYVNLGSYYLIGIPIGIVLGYVYGMLAKGVWIGMLVGVLTQTIVLLVITWKTDWDNQVDLVRERLSKWYVSESAEVKSKDEHDV